MVRFLLNLSFLYFAFSILMWSQSPQDFDHIFPLNNRADPNSSQINETCNTELQQNICNKYLSSTQFLLTEYISLNWVENQWANRSKEIYTYDSNNNKVETFIYDWYDTAWVNSYRETFSYDQNNNLIEELHYMWYGTKWDEHPFKIIFQYDSNNNRIERKSQYWAGSFYNNAEMITYSFDPDDNLLEELWQMWNNNSWENQRKIIYSYDDNRNMIQDLMKIWNNGNWSNYSEWDYAYDLQNNNIERVFKYWVGGEWSIYEKVLYEYDLNNNRISHIHYKWDGTAYEEASGRAFYKYDDYNNRIELIHQGKDGELWINQYKDEYSYELITDVNYEETLHTHYGLADNYPNPFNPTTTIEYSIPAAALSGAEVQQHVSLKVHDLLGREVATLVNEKQKPGNYEVEFNSHSGPVNSGTVQNLTSGIYFYRLQTDDYAETKKMILLK